MVQRSGLSEAFVKSLTDAKRNAAAELHPNHGDSQEQEKATARAWRERCTGLGDVPDPYASRGDTLRRTDAAAWDILVVRG